VFRLATEQERAALAALEAALANAPAAATAEELQNLVFEARNAGGKADRLPDAAAELVALKVDLILPQGTPPTIAASKATREIPILTTTTGDPVGSGLAASLARPGGNVTGSTEIAMDLISKRLDLLRQIDEAFKVFYDATVALGVANNVTTMTMTDFGRTLKSNGNGSDHGWGAHQLVMGGAVNGGRIVGAMPPVAGCTKQDYAVLVVIGLAAEG